VAHCQWQDYAPTRVIGFRPPRIQLPWLNEAGWADDETTSRIRDSKRRWTGTEIEVSSRPETVFWLNSSRKKLGKETGRKLGGKNWGQMRYLLGGIGVSAYTLKPGDSTISGFTGSTRLYQQTRPGVRALALSLLPSLRNVSHWFVICAWRRPFCDIFIFFLNATISSAVHHGRGSVLGPCTWRKVILALPMRQPSHRCPAFSFRRTDCALFIGTSFIQASLVYRLFDCFSWSEVRIFQSRPLS